MLGGSSLLALAFVGPQLFGRAETPEAILAASVASARPSPAAVLPPSPEPAAGGPVRRQGNDLLLDFDGVPLPEAVALLARATGTAVHDAESLLPSVLVTLHLRARSVGDAWKQLLQGRAAFDIACPVTGCQVVIAGERSLPSQATRATGAGGAGRHAEPAKAPTEEELSQPDGAC
ncbi:hypothetical protein [Piscinibacter koreensis]|uniref:Uncharacterized protein n=1 Tax=Piscinibacter koreensis TaxID=2742824 RepID=A0A7Y6NMW5_9BURK|nr:hypothetical protein [Schlegelella koreensis]NUZ06069.1 hypothetical protein [Schlegelella koreensis]